MVNFCDDRISNDEAFEDFFLQGTTHQLFLVELRLTDIILQDQEFNLIVQDWLESESSSLPESPYTLSSSESNREKTQITRPNDPEDRPRRKRARVTRRASTNAAYLPFLRILKRDIRRKYADMMNNTFNLYDPELVSKFFTTFAIPEFRYSDTVTEEIERKTVFRSAYVQGVQSILRLYVTPAYMLPDLLVRLESVRVCKRSDEPGSRVLSKVSMRGTLLYIPKVPINSVTVDDEGNVDRSQFQPQSPPKTVHLEGICVMHLDENHHIRVLEVVIDKLLE